MNAKIIICDDENLLRDMISDYFTTRGYEVEQARNGIECLKKAAATKDITAIILDIKMPEMDGLTATQELRRLGVKAPIFLMSGYADVTSNEQAKSFGATQFFPKPFALQGLSKAVSEIH